MSVSRIDGGTPKLNSANIFIGYQTGESANFIVLYVGSVYVLARGFNKAFCHCYLP